MRGQAAVDIPMLSRIEVARRLGKSVATVRRLEGVELHPTRDSSGVHRFDPDEVERLAAKIRWGFRLPWGHQAPHHRSPPTTGIRALEARLDALTEERDQLRRIARITAQLLLTLNGDEIAALDTDVAALIADLVE
jgi:hypothetical protein